MSEDVTIGQILDVLGYETVFEALKVFAKERGVWKEKWN